LLTVPCLMPTLASTPQPPAPRPAPPRLVQRHPPRRAIVRLVRRRQRLEQRAVPVIPQIARPDRLDGRPDPRRVTQHDEQQQPLGANHLSPDAPAFGAPVNGLRRRAPAPAPRAPATLPPALPAATRRAGLRLHRARARTRHQLVLERLAPDAGPLRDAVYVQVAQRRIDRRP